MDKKKIGKRERGGGRAPLLWRGTALLLSVLLFVFNFLPVNAYAEEYTDGDFYEIDYITFDEAMEYLSYDVSTFASGDLQTSLGTVVLTGGGKSYSRQGFGKITPANVLQSAFEYVAFKGSISETFNANDKVSVTTVFTYGRYKSFRATYKFVDYVSKTIILEKTLLIEQGKSNEFYSWNGSTNALTFYFDIPGNLKGELFEFECGLREATYFQEEHKNFALGFGISDFYASAVSEQQGFMSSVIQWLKNIIDSIKNLPSAIGDFISSLGDRISSFFTNLINNLKGWFENIGKWFTDLGNNIKQWFTNLTNNLKTWFENVGKWFSDLNSKIQEWFTRLVADIWTLFRSIQEFFISLFKPSDDYFDNLREDLDNHMSEHLGAVYNVPKALLAQLVDIVNGLKGATPNLNIAVPEFSFKLKGEKYVILEKQDFNLLSSINSIDEPETQGVYRIALIIMHGMIDLALAVGCFKMVYKKIINKVGIEGGDEL